MQIVKFRNGKYGIRREFETSDKKRIDGECVREGDEFLFLDAEAFDRFHDNGEDDLTYWDSRHYDGFSSYCMLTKQKAVSYFKKEQKHRAKVKQITEDMGEPVSF